MNTIRVQVRRLMNGVLVHLMQQVSCIHFYLLICMGRKEILIIQQQTVKTTNMSALTYGRHTCK